MNSILTVTRKLIMKNMDLLFADIIVSLGKSNKVTETMGVKANCAFLGFKIWRVSNLVQNVDYNTSRIRCF